MAATFNNTFENMPILAWAIDDWETLRAAVDQSGANFDRVVAEYKNNSYDNGVRLLYEGGQFKLNLGGDTEKTKLIKTDKPMGVFDFSLASKGLYKVIEYYSEKLAKEYPNRFVELDLPSGIVPPDFIKQKIVNGERVFYFEDANGVFDCEIRQKGETAILDGVKGAKKKFATRTKKVYLTYKRNKGKVKYVEIYSLFYYTSLSGDLQYAVRHIPAMMVADYLENIGVKVRFYMTRFVKLSKSLTLKKTNRNGVPLPMYNAAPNKKNYDNLFLQPIIAKDFLEEFDKPLAFAISMADNQRIYDAAARYSLGEEVTSPPNPYGDPDWAQNDYFEGLERYRNKYQEYVKLGILKSKEVLPEAMLFFHDMVIKKHFYRFMQQLEDYNFTGISGSQAEMLVSPYINPFFYFWMRMSANCLKDKIDLINSNELRKDLAAIEKVLQNDVDDLEFLLSNIPTTITAVSSSRGTNLVDWLRGYGYTILQEYLIVNYFNKVSFKAYIQNITSEITTYANGIFYASPQETIEKRDNLAETILEELKYF